MKPFDHLGVADDRISEEGNVLRSASRLGCRSLEQSSVHVKDAKGPPAFIGALASVNLSRIEYDNVSARGHVICAVVPETLRSIFNHTDCHAFMGMTCKGVRHVFGVQQLDVTDVAGPPKLCFFLTIHKLQWCAPLLNGFW